MLDVAVERIAAEGMTVGLDNIRMEAVIAEAGVSRATAYRRWASRDDFLADVLVETVLRTSLIPETEGDLARIVGAVKEYLPRAHDPQARRDLVVEALRVATDADVRRIVASPRWRTFLSLAATYQGLPASSVRTQVGEALAEAERVFTERRAAVYANLASLIGYRPVPPSTGLEGFRTLAAAAGAMMTGIVVRTLPNPQWLDQRTPARLFGASREVPWSEPERLVVGLLLSHLEPDPAVEWTPAYLAATLARFEDQVAAMFGVVATPLPRPPRAD